LRPRESVKIGRLRPDDAFEQGVVIADRFGRLGSPGDLWLGIRHRQILFVAKKASVGAREPERPGDGNYSSSAEYATGVIRCGLVKSKPKMDLANELSRQMAVVASAILVISGFVYLMAITPFLL
jgi:hypothetical protein